MKFAAIDIGSNAVRLLFSNVSEEKGKVVFKKSSLIRIPIRLGEDAFREGIISKEKEVQLIKTLVAFKNLIEVISPLSYRACATSAMREARNGPEIIKKIRATSGLNVEIIGGKDEAGIIYSNHIAETLDPDCDYLYVDVGGGSTELTLISEGEMKQSRSFNIGTIRMLYQQVSKDEWEGMKVWVRENVKKNREVIAIGSGGNINRLYKMSDEKNKMLSKEKLEGLMLELSMLTYDERVNQLGLNPDRADVIVPAGKIFHTIMKNGGINQVHVPQFGLADGLVHLLYEEWKSRQ